MRPPCETVQREFLPSLRAKVSHELKRAGLSQSEIAKKMDLTQAAVSKYLTQSNDRLMLSPEATLVLPNIIELMTSPVLSHDKIVKEVCSACMKSRLSSHVCKLHKLRVSSLRDVDCQICGQLLGGQDEDLTGRAQVIKDMQEAIHQIESCPSFKLVMPQVRANLVSTEGTATNLDEVAGIPGRITLVDGKARALSPQFGTSRHTAQLLLLAREQWPEIRSCLCISGAPNVVAAAASSGFQVSSVEQSTNDAEKIIESVKASTKRKKSSTNPAIHVPGGYGVEPILYLFGSSASELSDACIKLCDKLVK
ncbi:hypothetical protein EU527_01350 [Candidatus Thorarchaeota archaeon]|nr:MAG: hypothetical protein EU527_01350 [Candidatus Thorarchaeota archaeon]